MVEEAPMASEDQAFREHRSALLRYLFQLTNDAGLAEDIVQESYLRLLERDGMPDNPRSWLFRVATNLVRDHAAVEKRRRQLDQKRSLPSAPRAPDVEAETRERLNAVWRALYRLPRRDRALLLLRAQGFDYRDIADAVDIAPGSVGPLTGRALEQLNAELSSVEEGSGGAD